jgi:hypothetical protein
MSRRKTVSVPYQRISNATVQDIMFYDPAAERRAEALDVDWDRYFKVASQEWLYKMEFGWWQNYCDTVVGATYYNNLPNGSLISAFNPNLLIKNDQTLIRLDVFGAILVFYESLVTDVSNMNEVDVKNYEFAKERCDREWTKAQELSNWYDLFQDAPNGPTTKLEENWLADVNYFNGSRRYF